ncbi:RCC1 domain-containing protein [Paenibacillus sedimenti]|uniref:RCC1 domain-containing protein n=1 Tax=Paenibacillus sedimenti TaxID=2770274 RepID=UPI002898927E|nr:fibronectin type III domain-containing protein [Paenibacillus sedimenti]
MKIRKKSLLFACSFLVAAQSLGLGGTALAESVEKVDDSQVIEQPASPAPSITTVTAATYGLDTIAPTAPSGLTTTGTTASTISLAWSASQDNVGVTEYEIFSNGSQVGSSKETAYTVSDLSPNKSYTFTVRAKDAAGNTSEQSKSLTATTTPVVALLAANQFVFEHESLTRTGTDAITVVSDTAASGGKILSFNSNAVGDYIEFDVNITEAGTYSIATAVKFYSSRGTAQLSIDGVAQGTPIDLYKAAASYGDLSNGNVTINTPGIKKFRYTVTGKNAASPGYSLALDAIKLVKQTASDTVAPTAPSGLTSPGKTDTSVSLSWTASTDNVGVTGYDVYSGTTVVGTTAGTSFTATGLTPATAYTFTVKAKDAAGNVSAASNAVSATTNPAVSGQTLFEIESLPQADSGDASVVNSDAAASGGQWENYSANAAGDYVEYALNVPKSGSYEVIIKAKKGTANGTAQLSIDGNNLGSAIDFYKSAAAFEDTSRGLINFPSAGFKIVRFTVTGKNAASTGYALPLDAIKLVGTADTQAPTAPSNLVVTGKTGSSVSLSWSASTDNVGVTNYEIYNGTTKVATSPASAGTSYTVNGLTPNTSYTFTVKAVDGAGNVSAASNALTVSTSSQLAITSLPLTLGGNNSLFIRNDASLWSWGYNGYGQLGNGTTNTQYQPIQTINLTDVKTSAGGSNHTLAIKNDGSLYAWGYNGYGQLGDNSTTYRYSPVLVSSQTGFTSVAAGENHSLALKNDGTVWAFGNNGEGQLGDGTNTTQKLPVQVSNLSSVKAIAAGKNFSTALKSDGTVWTWGSSNYGELGNGQTTKSNVPVQVAFGANNPLTGITAIASGDHHVLALKSDGTIWSWGYNGNGELGNGSTHSQTTPVQILNFGSVKSIAAGRYFSFAIKQDGSLWGWGYNGYGQLGLGHTTTRTVPVQLTTLPSVSAVTAGDNHTIALGNDGILYSWGHNNHGQLGNGTNMTYSLPQKVIGPNVNPADTTAPATVTDFRSSATSNARQVRLDWTLTTDDVSVSKYEIYNGKVLVGTTDPWYTNHTVSNLALNTTYNFTIKAIDASGNRSVASTVVTATTSDKAPPTTPKDLVLLGVTNSTITLTWTGSTDNDVVKQYNVYAGATKLGSTASTSLTLTGLTSNTLYNLTVKAEDDSGNQSAASTVLPVTTE